MFNISYYFSEIKIRFIYIFFAWLNLFLISYLFKFELIYLISRPFLKIHNKFIFLDLPEALYITIQICILISCFLILPYCLYQLWSFIIPSRYNFERSFFSQYIVLFSLFFFFEVLGIYNLIFPKICEFLMSFEIKTLDSIISIELSARIGSYLNLFIKFFLFSLLFFQTPFLFLVLYSKTRLNSYNLCKNRKIFFFLAVIFSAFISPPDFFSQCFFSFVLFLFYEFLIFLGFFSLKIEL